MLVLIGCPLGPFQYKNRMLITDNKFGAKWNYITEKITKFPTEFPTNDIEITNGRVYHHIKTTAKFGSRLVVFTGNVNYRTDFRSWTIAPEKPLYRRRRMTQLPKGL